MATYTCVKGPCASITAGSGYRSARKSLPGGLSARSRAQEHQDVPPRRALCTCRVRGGRWRRFSQQCSCRTDPLEGRKEFRKFQPLATLLEEYKLGSACTIRKIQGAPFTDPHLILPAGLEQDCLGDQSRSSR
jgi:hypothetical protein